MKRWRAFFVFSILLVIEFVVGQSLFDCPEKCQCYPDPIEKARALHLVCKWDQINSTNLDAIRNPDAVRTLTIRCSHFAQKSNPQPRLFARLRYLDRLEIAHCPMESLPEELLQGMNYLYSLIIKHSSLEQIPPRIFDHLTSLMTLDLTGNFLRIEPPALASLNNLIQLDLSNNSIRYLSNALTNSLKLKVLSLDNNEIENIDFRRISNNLTDFTLKNNKINTFHYYPESAKQLRRLDLSGNRLDFIAASGAVNALPPDLRILDLKGNKIRQIQPGALRTMNKLTMLDLRNNSLQEIKEESLEINRTKFRTQVYLQGNPLGCSCSHRWMLHPQTKFSPIINDLNDLECIHMIDESRRMKIINADKNQGFLCKYDQHCLEGCTCCLSSPHDCSCVQNCPAGCNCWRSEGSEVGKPGQNVISCENVRMDRLRYIPETVTELHLIGSMWKDKGLKHLGHKEQLTLLNLSSSSIDYLNQTLLNQFPRLSTLDLSNNNLRSIKTSDLRLLQNLRNLRLHGNQLQNLSDDVLQYLSRFESITFGGEATNYSCDCKAPSDLQKWLIGNSAMVKDFDLLTCFLSNGTKVRMRQLDNKDRETICERVSTSTDTSMTKTSSTTTRTTVKIRTGTRTTGSKATTSLYVVDRVPILSIPQVPSSSEKNYDEKSEEDDLTFKSLPTKGPFRVSKSGTSTRPPPRRDIDSGFLYSLLIIILLLVVICLISAIASTVYLKLIRPKSYNVQKVSNERKVRSVDEEIPLHSS